MPRNLIVHPDPLPIAHPDTVRDKTVLERAAQIILERGHCRHTAIDEKGRVCIIQAIYFAGGDYKTVDRLVAARGLTKIAHGNIVTANRQMSARQAAAFLRGTAGR